MGRRVSGEMPQVRLHKRSGNGRVTVGGREVYVGRYGSPEARERYLELMVEHGYLPATAIPAAKPAEPEPLPLPAGNEDVPAGLTLGELCQMYLVHLEPLRPKGKPCSGWNRALAAVRAMRPLATMPAAKFGTRAFLDVRQRLVETPRYVQDRKPPKVGKRGRRKPAEPPAPPRAPVLLSRRWVNDVMQAVRAMFDWAVLHELVPDDRAAALRVVKRLKAGESQARETPPRKPVKRAVLLATLPYLTAEVADLVLFIRWTGCRPSEAMGMRWCRIRDRDKPVWRYVPRRHKTSHRGKQRHIPIGPKARAIIEAHAVGRDPRDFVFTPQRSLRRVEPVDGVLPMKQAKASPLVGERFTKDALRIAVRRAVDRANKARAKVGEPPLPHWTPYQLRYLRLREIRKRGGLEATQATAGHSDAVMTDHYAPANWGRAARAALASG
jgi:integrase